MVRLGAEKDLIDDFDWDALVAEQVGIAAAEEEEELKVAHSGGSVVTFDTTPGWWVRGSLHIPWFSNV